MVMDASSGRRAGGPIERSSEPRARSPPIGPPPFAVRTPPTGGAPGTRRGRSRSSPVRGASVRGRRTSPQAGRGSIRDAPASLREPDRGVLGVVGEDLVGAGAADRRENLERDLPLVEPAVL